MRACFSLAGPRGSKRGAASKDPQSSMFQPVRVHVCASVRAFDRVPLGSCASFRVRVRVDLMCTSQPQTYRAPRQGRTARSWHEDRRILP